MSRARLEALIGHYATEPDIDATLGGIIEEKAPCRWCAGERIRSVRAAPDSEALIDNMPLSLISMPRWLA